MEILTPCTIATPQNFILKFGTRDYGRDITKGILQICEIVTFVIFLLSLFFPILSTGQTAALAYVTQTTCFRARKCLLGVKIKSDAI